MEGENIVQPVESMPGICQYSVDRMNEELDRVKALQIPAILIFGIPEHKDEVGSGAYDEHGIVQTAIHRIKKDYPDLLVIADVCLCEYTSHGHCGLIRDGIILMMRHCRFWHRRRSAMRVRGQISLRRAI